MGNKDLRSDRKAPQSFVKRRGPLNQTIGNNFLNQSNESGIRSNNSSLTRKNMHGLGLTSKGRFEHNSGLLESHQLSISGQHPPSHHGGASGQKINISGRKILREDSQ